ncbi:hypothetical protein MNBD_PLANCTO02-1390 [hydrothermal vent metagenome]|uniref:Uncharacterized protein n=1 Tax=hydrothermal vent metagenome TaxID=652676 RepID=A0A3B1D923_9ZZZZ
MPRHPNKHIQKSIQYAKSLGWRFKLSDGHAWGRLLCPEKSLAGCIISVWSTPRNSENHARQLVRKIKNCPHATTSGKIPLE